MKTDSYRLHSRGFTIVELAVVIFVIGLLASIVIVVHRNSQRDAAEAVLRSDLTNLQAQLVSHNTFNGSYPATIADMTKSKETTFTYVYTAGTNRYCVSASTNSYGAQPYYITSERTTTAQGTCP